MCKIKPQATDKYNNTTVCYHKTTYLQGMKTRKSKGSTIKTNFEQMDFYICVIIKTNKNKQLLRLLEFTF